MQKQKVVVTGGAGFIGSYLVQALLSAGYEVSIVDTLVSGKRERVPVETTLHECDIRDTAALRSIFNDAQFVFHLAALASVPYSIEHPQESNDVNINGTLSVLAAARDAKVARVIFSSSSAVYSEEAALPIVEDSAIAPKSPYGLQKHVGELYCRLYSELYDLSTVSLRYFNVYGQGANAIGAYAPVVARFLEQMKGGQPITISGDGSQTRDFVHVRDVARANILGAENTNVGRGEVINIGTGVKTSVTRVAELLGGTIEHTAPRIELHDSMADARSATQLLGWKPSISFDQGVAEMKGLAGP